MIGKRYYISTLVDWRRHAARFTASHWFALNAITESAAIGDATLDTVKESHETRQPILILVEGDEGAHLALEDDPAFESLPHPLSQKPISAETQKALANMGIPSGATTFDVAAALARFHPLLRHCVF